MLLINSTSLGVSIANLWGSCQFSSKASVRFSKFCCHWIELFRLYPRTCWWFFWPCAFWIYPPVPSSTHQIPGCWWWSSLASWRDSSSAAIQNCTRYTSSWLRMAASAFCYPLGAREPRSLRRRLVKTVVLVNPGEISKEPMHSPLKSLHTSRCANICQESIIWLVDSWDSNPFFKKTNKLSRTHFQSGVFSGEFLDQPDCPVHPWMQQ